MGIKADAVLHYQALHAVGRPCMITETNFNVHKTTGQVELNFSSHDFKHRNQMLSVPASALGPQAFLQNYMRVEATID